MYYQEIAKKGYEYLIKRLEEQCNSTQEGGKMRTFSGENVENLVDYIFTCFQEKYNDSSLTIHIGKNKPVYIPLNNGKKYAESVDRHICKGEDIIYAIECKTYLDKCYLERAFVDYSLMKSNYHKKFGKIVLSIENSISDDAYTLFMSAGNIDNVFYLATGKRNSTVEKRIYYHPERLKIELFENFCKNLEENVFKISQVINT